MQREGRDVEVIFFYVICALILHQHKCHCSSFVSLQSSKHLWHLDPELYCVKNHLRWWIGTKDKLSLKVLKVWPNYYYLIWIYYSFCPFILLINPCLSSLESHEKYYTRVIKLFELKHSVPWKDLDNLTWNLWCIILDSSKPREFVSLTCVKARLCLVSAHLAVTCC